ncbi:MAG: NAD(P)H-hydrate dehydratase [Proteobacteria bacterium]|nr:NAD(P)H-hydrate dehydratase [Pseudomonadota bacterium]
MKNIYLSKQIKSIDTMVAEHLQISSFELMQLAGAAIFSYIKNCQSLLIVTGVGNNAGDGFIIADLARKKGIQVVVWSLNDINGLPKNAGKAAQHYLHNGGEIITQEPLLEFDCIVDAIFGTGLCRDIKGKFGQAINWINAQSTQVLAVDIPSGLDANTGAIRGCAINANMTISVICHKVGQHTNNGKEQCGNLYLEDLGYYCQTNYLATNNKLLDKSVLKHSLFNRQQNSHKGLFGSVAIVGGHDGMLGAVMLAGNAALRSGCGLVEVVSNQEQIKMVSIHSPELMTASDVRASGLMANAKVIAVGPGLGLNQQSMQALEYCIAQNKPMVVDADALHLLAKNHKFTQPTVLTPHPKEAAALLNSNVKSIQANRIKATKEISKKFNAVVILKGSGTIIVQPNSDTYICPYGYAGMATAGTGDVLTGIVASLMAQNFSPIAAAYTAVVWHALAAEQCLCGNGLIASDIIKQLPQTII